jgi:hypothetical protein
MKLHELIYWLIEIGYADTAALYARILARDALLNYSTLHNTHLVMRMLGMEVN